MKACLCYIRGERYSLCTVPCSLLSLLWRDDAASVLIEHTKHPKDVVSCQCAMP